MSDNIAEVATESRSKRISKKPEFFTVAVSAAKPKASEAKHEGSGVTLGDYEYFVEASGKLKSDDEVLKSLHSLLYGTPGKKTEVKKNLRAFNGFSSSTDLKDKTDKLIDKKKQWTVTVLKSVLGLFGLEKSGDREELCKRLIEYLGKPEAVKSGKAASPSSSRKRKASSKKPKKGSKKAKKEGKKRTASSFILFGNAKRDEVKKANPAVSFGEIGRIIGKMWNDLSADEKKPFEEQAAKLKAEASEATAEASEEEEEEEEEEEGSEEEGSDVEEENDGEDDKKADSDDDDLFD